MNNEFIAVQIKRYLVLPTVQIQVFNSNWFSIIWLIGVVIIFVLWFISHRHFSKKLLLTKVNKNALLIQLPPRLNIYKSKQAYSPMLIDFFKQKLVIPENFTKLYSPDQQKLILEHEICHFDRNDIYWNFIALVCLALFWFHPLVWLAYFSFRRDQELSCDQTVLARKQIQCRINYSKALLVTAESAPPFAFAQLSFKKYGDKHMMYERIKQIKANKHATKLGLAMVVATAVSLLSGLSYAGNLGTPGAEINSSTALTPIYRVEPKYPIKAAVEKIEGSVVLKFDVDTDGSVKNVEVVKGKPAYVFDKVAVTALKQWQYQPLNNIAQNNLVQLDFAMDEHTQ